MAWENRPYYRQHGRPMAGALRAIFFGSVPLFRLFGVRVRAHSFLFLFVVLVLAFGLGPGFTRRDRFESMAVLCALLLLHELGHFAAARRGGGDAEEIVLNPVGGFLATDPSSVPPRPRPAFFAVAAGPAVNVVVCLAFGGAIFALAGDVPLSPWHLLGRLTSSSWPRLLRHLNWVYAVSYLHLLLNLLPLYPLDGGQLLHAMMWAKLGWFRSAHAACVAGMIGAIPLIAYGAARHSALLPLVGANCLGASFLKRRALRAAGSAEMEEDVDFRESLREPPPPPRRRRRISVRKIRRLRRLAQREAAERARIDQILAKVSAHGLASLTWRERRALHKATERERRREIKLAREQ